ncbi:MAG: o-succinylbenzoate synthase [Bacteroidetes bacterium]|nr:MAG: o-succinylbenzoate synthase [Bacteroidota bacterium]TAG86445.1 MAG: o-succinylbenzoate synthase [Bacteroidota bacterium]
MFTIQFIPYQLQFKFEAGTSRGVLKQRDSFFVLLTHTDFPNQMGIGEISPLFGLSIDFDVNIRQLLQKIAENFTPQILDDEFLKPFPAVQFGLETAYLDWKNGGKRIIFDNNFSKGTEKLWINGLIWMGSEQSMQQQIEDKLEKGFRCLKLKIGALDFETELGILKSIRQKFSAKQITLRVDANGAFLPENALEKLKKLADFELHSIEQPIMANQIEKMAELVQKSPVPIALDEELIGINDTEHKKKLLETIKPPFIILKPTLLGGLKACEEWIKIAESMNINWWITSALESNIGLNAIAQFTANFNNNLPQGLGTGGLYHNNIDSALYLEGEYLGFDVNYKTNFLFY